MEHRLLGGTGFSVPVLTFGTVTFGGNTDFFRAIGATQQAEATRLVDLCLDAGVNMFDSADSYSNGLAEKILGQAIAGRQNRVLISTKAAHRAGPGPNDIGSSRHHLIAACEGSLRRLGVDHIDLYQLHGFDAVTPIEETIRALDDLVRAGKVRYVGCSNFSAWHLMKSLGIADRFGWSRHVAHQAYYSLICRDYEWELMPLALDQKVGTVVWSPLGGGRLSGKIGRDRPPPPGTRIAAIGGAGPAFAQEQFYTIIETLEAIAREIGRSVPQVALNWVLQRPSVATVIIGARNEAQLRDNLGAVEFKLTAEQMERLDAVSARPPIYPNWQQARSLPDRNPPAVPLPKA
jgi:aryl-alcohol dehydrogenase-like predicted oxidoreductase